jgi:hypothetical protein
MLDDVVTVHLLTILNRYGTELYVFRERSIARQQLYEYVCDVWDDRFSDIDCPENENDAIEDFFDQNEESSYILVERDVLEEPVRD